jgi:predicted O-linked N-acetylglucosamine transferase (SPINDLY family)
MNTLRECLVAAANAAAAGDRDAAIAAYRSAVAFAPRKCELYYNLAVLLADAGDYDDAERALAAAATLEPEWGTVPLARGRIAYRRLRFEAAQQHYERAVALLPDSVEALGNLALALCAQKRHADALPRLQRARALAPADEDVWFALRECQLALGREADALADFHAFERQAAPSARLAAAGFISAILEGDADALAKYLSLALEWPYVPADAPVVAGLMARLQYVDVPRATLLAVYRAYDRLQQANRDGLPPFALPAAPHPGRLRVGYLSADFRDHVMGRLLHEVFAQHDRGAFEVHGYSLTAPASEDAMTERFRGAFDAFVDLSGLDDVAAARRIADDRLDVLVDLMAHSSFSRPAILLYKPALVIVTHLGYHGCVGLTQVDYKMTDRYADAADAAEHQIEAPLAIGTCVLPVRRVPCAGAPLTRAECGIAEGAVVFGTFVGPVKLSTRCVALWRRILERVPQSVLAFSPYVDADRPLLVARLARGGIGAERIVFLPTTWDEVRDRRRYGVIDVVLDTMPYTGGDTTVAALDMGVPVVTRRGERHAERMSYSILAHLGITETVAATDEDYVDIACRLATDPAWRAEVSAAIARQFAATPLADPHHYIRCFEAALREAVARGPRATS